MASSPSVVILFLTTLLVLPIPSMASCDLPEVAIMMEDDPPWHSRVMAGGSHDHNYYIRRTLMEIHYPNSKKQSVRWLCVMPYQDKFLLKRQDYLMNSYYKCVRFHVRSTSILQISWSRESKTFDPSLCEDSLLSLEPWPLVGYKTLDNDYTPCPLSGGFDMKITDSHSGENGCNLMHRPMRMEVECLGGDGVVFDYISESCLPNVNMFVKQKTTCVAGWKDEKNYFVILRRNEDKDLWCLVMPVQRGKQTTAYLYNDLICRYDKFLGDKKEIENISYLKLHLEQRVFPSLCEDEYDECRSVECNNYARQECMRSCNACNRSRDLADCHFPRRFRGPWFLKESVGYRQITLSQSDISIQGVGKFHCVNFPDSPPKKSRTFSTVSIFDNGCRPRYTCLKLHRLAPSVLQYSLSQSYVWPSIKNKFAKTMCNPKRFEVDPSPIDDLYRSHTGSGKPIIAQESSPEPVPCNISSVYTLTASSPEGHECSGSLYRHCEDKSKLRLDFSSCGGLLPITSDFRCLASFEGHYWEKIIVIQNMENVSDVRCFVFSQFYPNEAFVMVASQCDKKSFNFARSKIRQPLLSLRFREETSPCISVPSTPHPTLTTAAMLKTTPKTSKQSRNSWTPVHTPSSHDNRSHADQGHRSKISLSNSDKSSKQQTREYDVAKEDTTSRSRNSFGSNSDHNSSRGTNINECVLILVTLSFMVSLFR